MRSARGLIRRRERSKIGKGMLVLCEKPTQEAVVPAIFGNDDIGAGLDETVALPLIDAPARDFVAGDGDGDPAGAADFLDLHESIAEAEQFLAVQVMIADDLLDDHLFGEVLEV